MFLTAVLIRQLRTGSMWQSCRAREEAQLQSIDSQSVSLPPILGVRPPAKRRSCHVQVKSGVCKPVERVTCTLGGPGRAFAELPSFNASALQLPRAATLDNFVTRRRGCCICILFDCRLDSLSITSEHPTTAYLPPVNRPDRIFFPTEYLLLLLPPHPAASRRESKAMTA